MFEKQVNYNFPSTQDADDQPLRRVGVSTGCGTPKRCALIRIVFFKLHHYRR